MADGTEAPGNGNLSEDIGGFRGFPSEEIEESEVGANGASAGDDANRTNLMDDLRRQERETADSDSSKVNNNNQNKMNGTAEQGMQAMMMAMTEMMKSMKELKEQSVVKQNEEFQIMPDITKSINYFDGERDVRLAREWLDGINVTANIYKWPECVKIEAARTHLVGAAKSWYAANRHNVKTWKDFEDIFKSYFIKTISESTKWENMIKRKQLPKETLTAYFFEKQKLCQELAMSVEATKEEIIKGLWLREKASHLLAIRHGDINEFWHDLTKIQDTLMVKNRESFTVKPQYNQQENVSKDVKCYKCGVSGHLAKTCSESVRCFHCNAEGHKSVACPSKKELKCFGCNKTGHFKKDCKENKQLQIENNNYTGEQKFFKDVMIEGRETVRGFVDPGSAVCAIREEVAGRLKLGCTPYQTKLFGYGSVNPIISDWKATVKVKIDEVDETVDVVVVPDKIQDVDILIGRTFTEKARVAYVKIGNKLTFGYCDRNPFDKIKIEQGNGKEKLMVSRDVKLQAGQINKIEICAYDHEHQLSLISENTTLLRKGDVIGEVRVRKVQQEVFSVGKELQPDEITIESGNEEEKQALVNLCNKYRTVFARNISEIGCTDKMEVKIDDIGDPVRCKPYRASLQEREKMKEILSEWRENGIIRDTNSAYASPALLVPKANGEKRLVVDFRRLNLQTVKTNFPIATIDECFERLAGSKLFCGLDLMSGYLQVPLEEASKHKTAFITPDETAEFERLCFGLTNAPYEFCKLMSQVLGPLKTKVVVSYLDDVLVPAKTWTEMLGKLESVFIALREAKLTLNVEKCEFARTRIDFLGFELSTEGLTPGKRKLYAIESFPRPENATQVRRLLGLTGYFRRFIEQYATVTRPLSDLTKKHARFVWDVAEEQAFQELKEKLQTAPVLSLFDVNARTELHCDASSRGLGALLLQEGADEKMHLVYCVSKKTTEAESRYHSSKLELMCIVWAVERLRHLLLGVRFTVVSDCQALVYLNAKKTLQPQVARWYNLLSEYDFEIRYKSAEKMQHADCLSRAPVEPAANEESLEEIVDRKLGMFQIVKDGTKIVMIQHSDERLSRIIDTLKKENRTHEETEVIQGYMMKDGTLYRQIQVNGEERELIVLPDCMRKAIAVQYHNLRGHWSVDKTISLILRYYWFRGMRNYIKNHIVSCMECLFTKLPRGKRPGPLHAPKLPSRPFAKIHIDHVGPMPTTRKGNIHIMVIVDAFSRLVRLYAVKSTGAEETCRYLEEYILQYGAPEIIITDRGTAFTSIQFSELCEKFSIDHRLIASHYAQANGMVERQNGTIIPMLVAIMRHDNVWDESVGVVERNVNISINKTTGKSPFEAVYGYQPTYEDSGMIRKLTGGTSKSRNEMQEELRKTVEREQRKYTARYNAAHARNVVFEVGDIVVMRKIPVQTGQPTKLQLKYKGPLVVTEVLGSDTYAVEALVKGEGGRTYATTAHASQLKVYRNHRDDEEENELEDVDEFEGINDEEKSNSESTDEEEGAQEKSDEEWSPGDSADVVENGHTRPQRQRRAPKWTKEYVQFEVKLPCQDGRMLKTLEK